LGWSGNFKIEFEVDPLHNLRLIAGINPMLRRILWQVMLVLKLSLIYTLSQHGKGLASRTSIIGQENIVFWTVQAIV
jgi:alpha-galactosidase